MGLKRPPHIIKANKRTELPAEAIFFDCETTEEEIEPGVIQHNLKVGVGAHVTFLPTGEILKQDWLTFTRPEDYWRWGLGHVHDGRRMVFLAHNLNFDFLVVNGLTHLAENNYHVKSMICSGKIDIWTFVRYKYKPNSKQWDNYKTRYDKRPRVIRTALFLDTMNYFDTTLKALGESIGCHKIDIDFDTCGWDELVDYCKNDVLIMIEAWRQWLSFIHIHDLGVWGRTLPSQAFNAYRHRFMPHKIRVHTHEKATALERAGYFGGRCECFQLGHFDEGPYYLLDINSMYPYVMQKYAYPTKLLTYIKQATMEDLTYYMDSCGVIAEVMIDAFKPCFPKRIDGKLCFPTGKFWTTLTSPEIQFLGKGGRLIAIRSMAVYQLRTIFSDYVGFFYNRRLEYRSAGNDAFQYCCKILMNSLYGKFGQKIDNFVTIADDPEHGIGFYGEYDVEEKKWLQFRRMNGHIDVSLGFEEGYHSFVAISAFVTAHARAMLYGIIDSLHPKDLFYCDTDSIIVNQAGLKAVDPLDGSNRLGALALEKFSETLTIFGNKDYVFGNKAKIKGVRIAAKYIDDNTFGQWQQRSLKRVLWNNQKDNCHWKWVEKVLQSEYTKGLVGRDGMVTPFCLDETLTDLPF